MSASLEFMYLCYYKATFMCEFRLFYNKMSNERDHNDDGSSSEQEHHEKKN